MELLVFGQRGARMLVFPTRGGRFYDYEDWGQVDAIRDKIAAGWLQLFCVDSIDAESFYCGWRHPRDRIRRHLQYEAYLIHEVLPFTRQLNDNMFMITHGCSMGAYHALNFALRHPHLVGKVAAFSGRYDLTQPVAEFGDLFDGHYDELIYFNTPCHFLPNLHDSTILSHLRRMEITITIGADDPFYANNRHLSTILQQRNIPHDLHVWDGRAHKPRHWRKMGALYL